MIFFETFPRTISLNYEKLRFKSRNILITLMLRFSYKNISPEAGAPMGGGGQAGSLAFS